jgi:site-specific recombinase XerD
MSQDNVEQLVQKYGKKAQEHCPQVPDRIYPHLFRHSRASHLYRAGIPLPIISRFLGHAHLSTTDIYASADVEMIRSSLQSISDDKKNPVQPIWKDNDEMLAKLCGLT